MQAFTKHTGLVVPMDRANIDTDQIIPARFLLGTSTEGLGEGLFADTRESVGFVRSPADHHDRRILVAGANFGCGSSREHAPWALVQAGFRVVIAVSFADIFRTNALKNGLLPLQLTAKQQGALVDFLKSSPDSEIVVDVVSRTVTLEDKSSAQFPIPEFARHCLINGLDELDFILSHETKIKRHELTYE